jgi:hypothetical protein
MDQVASLSPVLDTPFHMPRRKKTPEEQGETSASNLGGQVNFKVNHALWDRLRAVADGLALDMGNLVRTIVKENLHIYERRAKEADHPDAD